MATRKCPNGHQYDSSIYGDNCPFCPSQAGGETIVNPGNNTGNRTYVVPDDPTKPTVPIEPTPNIGGGTVIRSLGDSSEVQSGRKLVGLLVSYDINKMGDVFHLFEGRNIIGRGNTSDIVINDKNVSSKHLLILYREAEGVFWAADQNSSNGTYINGSFVSDRISLKTNDIVVLGATKFVFIAIPKC